MNLNTKLNINKKAEEFARLLVQLEPVEFVGVARILCIQLVNTETKENRDFFEIFNDMIEKFSTLGRKQRRDLIKVIKKAKQENASTKNQA